MIKYKESVLGYRLIFHVQGSAFWKACLPALSSTGLMLVYIYAKGFDDDTKETGPFRHPYVITVYLTFFSFLLTFRLNYAYQRYWEGASAVFVMLSKWLDVATYLGAYHYQSQQYDRYRPPSFGHHETLRNMTRERERENEMTRDEAVEALKQTIEAQRLEELRNKQILRKLLPSAFRKKRSQQQHHQSERERAIITSERARPVRKNISVDRSETNGIPAPRSFQEHFSHKDRQHRPPISESGNRYSMRRRSTKRLGLKSAPSDLRSSDPVKIPYPSLFLQETAHLVSLLAGVALSTLRNDLDGTVSPLAEYFPGQPLPPVNSYDLDAEWRKDWEGASKTKSALRYLFGLTRDDRHRTLYNAARPFQVLGGVSDAEILKLQLAHGPYAKVSLCSMYVQEFVAREYLSGSTGKIPGPLISRITHVLSDGMTGYNQARKLAYNQFPFPHAQMTIFFTIAVLFIFPLLYYNYVNDIFFACLMNFVTVLCFLGIHEVARELENPMHNIPNDLPLTTYQAQFNEALITIYSGFHPDSWWEVDTNMAAAAKTEPLQEDEKENVHPLKR